MRQERMRVLQIAGPGRARWREMPVPALAPGEVLVKVRGVTTCPHWDLHLMDGEPMFPGDTLSYPYTPGEPGHEAVGEIAALGPGVEGWEVGTRVAAWRDPGGRRQGCYAQYAPLDARHLLRVSPDLPLEAIASLELAMCVQVSFDQLVRVDGVLNKRFCVSGLGPAGLIAVQMARSYGAREVVGIDPMEDRRTLAATLGADTVLAPEEVPADRSGPTAFDAALDTTGLKVSIDFLVERTRATVAIFGVLREYIGFGPANWWGGFTLMGYGAHNRGAAERALHLIEKGRLNLAPLVTCRLPLTRYAEGVELLRSKAAIKVLFLPWEDEQGA